MHNLKNRTSMKTLAISAIIAVTFLVNAASAMAGNRTNKFAYNTETIGNRVETQEVFKAELLAEK
ncbi:DUF3836 domain-containing protein [Bacteroides fluxus]